LTAESDLKTLLPHCINPRQTIIAILLKELSG